MKHIVIDRKVFMKGYYKTVIWILITVSLFGFIDPYLFSQDSDISVIAGLLLNIIFGAVLVETLITFITRYLTKTGEKT